MCTLSMIAQDWHDRHPRWVPVPYTNDPVPALDWDTLFPQPVSRKEFEELKKELAALKGLLEAAKKYDTETGQKDCEDAEKIAIFKRLAKITGVDLTEVLK